MMKAAYPTDAGYAASAPLISFTYKIFHFITGILQSLYARTTGFSATSIFSEMQVTLHFFSIFFLYKQMVTIQKVPFIKLQIPDILIVLTDGSVG